jgi:hypothetical protein
MVAKAARFQPFWSEPFLVWWHRFVKSCSYSTT